MAVRKCEAFTSQGIPCDKPAKNVATHWDGQVRWVCGTHARSLESQGAWKILSPERYQAEGRGVSAWIMVPIHVTIDTSGVGKVVQAAPHWDHARLARDDFEDPLDFEVAEPVEDSPFWQGMAARNAAGEETMDMERPTPAERKRFEDILWEDLQEWFEQEAAATGSGTWVTE